jgi:hypothetical protein
MGNLNVINAEINLSVCLGETEDHLLSRLLYTDDFFVHLHTLVGEIDLWTPHF